jgi:hypothetical protein
MNGSVYHGATTISVTMRNVVAQKEIAGRTRVAAGAERMRDIRRGGGAVLSAVCVILRCWQWFTRRDRDAPNAAESERTTR